jgi:copper chaperone CopZ
LKIKKDFFLIKLKRFEMKNAVKFISAAMLAFALVFSVSFAGEKGKTEIKTSAYSWMCKNNIETSISKLDGVEDCELDLTTRTLTVKYDTSKLNKVRIKTTIEDLGYDAEIKPEVDKVANTEEKEQR